MKTNASAGSKFGAGVGSGLKGGAVTKNRYRFVFRANEPGGIEVRRRDGAVLHVDEWVEDIGNLTTVEGRTNALQQYFKGSGYYAAWYVGLISNENFGALDAGDTAAKITTGTPNPPTTNNWKEATEYSEATRPAITFANAANASITSSATPSTFTINASVTLYGGFVISNNTKGGTAGLIYGEGAFSSTISLSSGTVSVYCTLTLNNA